MKRTVFAALFSLTLLIALQAFAMDLATARSSGVVGEKLDGYAAVIGTNAEATSLVADVNARRKAEYEKISKDNNQPVSVVAKVAAQTVIGGLPAGAYYQAADGSWKKK